MKKALSILIVVLLAGAFVACDSTSGSNLRKTVTKLLVHDSQNDFSTIELILSVRHKITDDDAELINSKIERADKLLEEAKDLLYEDLDRQAWEKMVEARDIRSEIDIVLKEITKR